VLGARDGEIVVANVVHRRCVIGVAETKHVEDRGLGRGMLAGICCIEARRWLAD
jgi:hypothetical protein